MKVLLITADRSTTSGEPQNIGDALLTDALASALREHGHEVVVADFGGGDRTSAAVPRRRLGGLRSLAVAARASDVVLLGGGTLLADDQPDRPFAGLPRLCLAARVVAAVGRSRFAVFGAGMDETGRRRVRLAHRLVLRGVPVWLRDADSASRAARLGATADVCGDVSLFLSETVAALGADVGARRGAVLALNRNEARDLGPGDVGDLAGRHGTVSFVSMDQGDDGDAQALPVGLDGLDVVGGPLSWQRAAEAIGAAEVVVASRMHALYIAAMCDVPSVATASSAKVRSFVDDYDVAYASTTSEAAQTRARSGRHEVELRRRRLDAAFSELDRWIRA